MSWVPVNGSGTPRYPTAQMSVQFQPPTTSAPANSPHVDLRASAPNFRPYEPHVHNESAPLAQGNVATQDAGRYMGGLPCDRRSSNPAHDQRQPSAAYAPSNSASTPQNSDDIWEVVRHQQKLFEELNGENMRLKALVTRLEERFEEVEALKSKRGINDRLGEHNARLAKLEEGDAAKVLAKALDDRFEDFSARVTKLEEDTTGNALRKADDRKYEDCMSRIISLQANTVTKDTEKVNNNRIVEAGKRIDNIDSRMNHFAQAYNSSEERVSKVEGLITEISQSEKMNERIAKLEGCLSTQATIDDIASLQDDHESLDQRLTSTVEAFDVAYQTCQKSLDKISSDDRALQACQKSLKELSHVMSTLQSKGTNEGVLDDLRSRLKKLDDLPDAAAFASILCDVDAKMAKIERNDAIAALDDRLQNVSEQVSDLQKEVTLNSCDQKLNEISRGVDSYDDRLLKLESTQPDNELRGLTDDLSDRVRILDKGLNSLQVDKRFDIFLKNYERLEDRVQTIQADDRMNLLRSEWAAAKVEMERMDIDNERLENRMESFGERVSRLQNDMTQVASTGKEVEWLVKSFGTQNGRIDHVEEELRSLGRHFGKMRTPPLWNGHEPPSLLDEIRQLRQKISHGQISEEISEELLNLTNVSLERPMTPDASTARRVVQEGPRTHLQHAATVDNHLQSPISDEGEESSQQSRDTLETPEVEAEPSLQDTPRRSGRATRNPLPKDMWSWTRVRDERAAGNIGSHSRKRPRLS